MNQPDMIQWHVTAEVRPKDGQVVDVITLSGQQFQMVVSGGRFCHRTPTGLLAVYFTPVFWKPAEGKG